MFMSKCQTFWKCVHKCVKSKENMHFSVNEIFWKLARQHVKSIENIYVNVLFVSKICMPMCHIVNMRNQMKMSASMPNLLKWNLGTYLSNSWKIACQSDNSIDIVFSFPRRLQHSTRFSWAGFKSTAVWPCCGWVHFDRMCTRSTRISPKPFSSPTVSSCYCRIQLWYEVDGGSAINIDLYFISLLDSESIG